MLKLEEKLQKEKENTVEHLAAITKISSERDELSRLSLVKEEEHQQSRESIRETYELNLQTVTQESTTLKNDLNAQVNTKLSLFYHK